MSPLQWTWPQSSRCHCIVLFIIGSGKKAQNFQWFPPELVIPIWKANFPCFCLLAVPVCWSPFDFALSVWLSLPLYFSIIIFTFQAFGQKLLTASRLFCTSHSDFQSYCRMKMPNVVGVIIVSNQYLIVWRDGTLKSYEGQTVLRCIQEALFVKLPRLNLKILQNYQSNITISQGHSLMVQVYDDYYDDDYDHYYYWSQISR